MKNKNNYFHQTINYRKTTQKYRAITNFYKPNSTYQQQKKEIAELSTSRHKLVQLCK